MKFHVNRDVFSEAVSFVVKLLPQRNPQPILAGVLIEASDAGLSLAAFDYEASARTTIEATVDEPGTILVHGRLLSEIASRLPNAPIQVEVDDDGGIVLTLRIGALHPRVDAGAGVPGDPRGHRRLRVSCPPRTSPPRSRRWPSPRRATTSPRCSPACSSR